SDLLAKMRTGLRRDPHIMFPFRERFGRGAVLQVEIKRLRFAVLRPDITTRGFRRARYESADAISPSLQSRVTVMALRVRVHLANFIRIAGLSANLRTLYRLRLVVLARAIARGRCV